MADVSSRISGLSAKQLKLLAEKLREAPGASSNRIERKAADKAPLSLGQERLWFIDQLEPGNAAYNNSVALRVKGGLSEVEEGINEIIKRHEVLRSCFPMFEGKPIQMISPSLRLRPSLVDLSSLPAAVREAMATQLSESEVQRPFDLMTGPLLRSRTLILGEEDFVLLNTQHHIITDGFSDGIMQKELAYFRTFYHRLKKSASSEIISLLEVLASDKHTYLPELPIQYADYAVWERGWLQGDVLDRLNVYWKKQLADLPVSNLPTDRPRSEKGAHPGARQAVTLSGELTDALIELSQQEGATLFMTLLAAFKVLLYRYSGQDDIVVGSPIAGRHKREAENLVGFFVNMLVLRTGIDGRQTFKEILRDVKETCLGAYAHQEMPFAQLVKELNPDRALDRHPLFQIAFQLNNTAVSFDMQTGDSAVSNRFTWLDTKRAMFDLQLTIDRILSGGRLGEGGFKCVLEYDAGLFERQTATRMINHFERLLKKITDNADQTIDEIEILSNDERQRLLVDWNETPADSVKGKCIQESFEEQARSAADRIAVTYEDHQLTYADLNKRSNQLAHYLRARGVGRDVVAGICIERSVEMIIGLLGILKAGGAYLPIEPDHPAERIAYLLEDSGIDVLLTRESTMKSLPYQPTTIICIDLEKHALAREPEINPPVETDARNLAYVIYTSGSTGKPKGVLIEHHQVSRLFEYTKHWYEFGPNDVWTMLHSYAFDFSVWEIWGALLHGGQVVVAPNEVRKNPEAVYELLREKQVTILNQTPSAFRQLSAVDERIGAGNRLSLRVVIFGGEALEIGSLRGWFDRHGDEKPALINMYGITETTVHVTYRPIRTEEARTEARSVIGRRIPDLKMYLLDKGWQPIPIGVIGEIFVGGAGQARGYLGKPDLTAERFIPNTYGGESGERMYRTGDLARYRSDGEMEYVGRADDQVKIRGYRIELGEIETVLGSHPLVRESAVTACEDAAGGKRLVSYVVCHPSARSSTETSTESSSPHERVSQWEMIFDDIYSRSAGDGDPTFNTIGWNSNYTDQPIPASEMKEWLEYTAESILSLRPRRVLEIGCGTGLLLFKLASQCEFYRGTDVSRQAIDYTRFHWENLNRGAPRVELWRRAADNFEEIEPESFDVVVINSVVQYFPNIEYLVRVLEGAVKATAPGGSIFIGDIRSLPLLKAFHAAITLNRAERELPIAKLQQRMQDQISGEEELAIDPAFFFALKRHLPRISGVEVLPKRGSAHNELTQFRYQVIVHVGRNTGRQVEVAWMDWHETGLSLPAVKKLLAETSPEVLGIVGVANARVVTEAKLAELLANGSAGKGPQTAGELQDLLGSAGQGVVDPHHLWGVGEESDYEAYLSWAQPGTDGRFDVLFIRKDDAENRARLNLVDCFAPSAATNADSRAWDKFANNPLQGSISRSVVTQLRRYLQAKLPEYMVPSAFVLMDALPLNHNGKIDRRALPGADSSRPELEEAFIEPCNEIERQLAGIWAEVLRLDKVGVHDNFFELGGDSILGIQIISKANQAGLQLSPRHIFQNQTVAELAAVTGAAREIEADQSLVTGSAPLTPIQHWFFEQDLADAHHFNQARMLELRHDVEPALLKQAVEALVNHHDALRLRFHQEDGEWREINVSREDREVFSELDLSGVAKEELPRALYETASRIQASLRLSEGPLITAVLINLGVDAGKRFLIAIHHLVVDGVSWRILLEDLQRGYEEAKRGEKTSARKTTSFQRWAQKLNAYAQSDDLKKESSYWIQRKQTLATGIPLDHESGENTVESSRSVVMWLSKEETSALLQDVPATFRTQINDILLAALALACREWSGDEHVLISLEGHGREEIIEGVDITRTVGWFTTMYPVMLELGEERRLGEVIKSVKEQLRAIPNKGIGYGLLRYLSNDDEIRGALKEGPDPDLVFNYLGQLGRHTSEPGLFGMAKESAGPVRSGEQKRSHKLEVNGGIFGGRLKLIWTYSENLHRRETIAMLADRYKDRLKAIVEHCRSKEAGGYTPSDFPLAGLNQEQLDKLIGGDRNIEDIYRLSPMQEGLLFHSLYQPEDGAYVVQMCVLTAGNVSLEELQKRWRRVAEKNDLMRAWFIWEGVDSPVQVVRRQVDVPVEYKDWRSKTNQEQQDELDRYLSEDRRRGFNLKEAPLMRICLIRRGDDLYQWIWSHHHLLMDGWSLPLVLNQLSGAAGEASETRPYRDYIQWLQKQDLRKAETYWRESLKGFAHPTRIGIEKAVQNFGAPREKYREESLTLSKEATDNLEKAARTRRLTLNTLVQGGWGLLLSRYSGEKDVVYGVTVSGRPADLTGIDKVVGVFINTLPVRLRVGSEETAADCLKRLQDQQAEMRQYEYSPLLQVQAWSDVPRGEALFESIFAYENYPLLRPLQDRAKGSKLREMRLIERTNYPLSIVAIPGEHLQIKIIYDQGRYDERTIKRLLDHYQRLLESLTERLERRVSEIDILTAEEKQLLRKWNDTTAEYPSEKCIHELLEDRAVIAADRVALVYEDQHITYAELNRRSNQLAHFLSGIGVGPEVVTGICVDRSPEMIVGLLGILKAGGAYLPLDPQNPGQRLRYMLDDAGVTRLVTTSALVDELGGFDRQVILLDSDWEKIAGRSDQNPFRALSSRDAAYVIYTSGSTGKPKGVMVEHRGAQNMAEAQIRSFGVTSSGCVLQFASLSFDASIFEIVMALRAGARLCLAPKEKLLPGPGLVELINGQGVTHITVPPSALAMVPDDAMPGLTTIIAAGEACPETLATQWGFGRRFFNAYGPTEATVWSSVQECDGTGTPSIGRTIANVQIHILDSELNPAPVGARGEIFIAGDSLARGYLGRPEMTAERFIANPFSAKAGSKLYRTGDLGRYRADGLIEYLGRADHQVKIRGYRIEIGEIEAALREHEAVGECVVTVREVEGEKQLTGYFVGGRDEELDASDLRGFLKNRLPEYMIPAAFVILDKMPLTQNGKIDRASLPEPKAHRLNLREPYVPPRNEAETIITSIWQETLRVDRVGLNDNFFDLGGHSLLMIKIHNKLQSVFNRKVPMVEMFRHPTVRGMAAHLTDTPNRDTSSAKGRSRAMIRKKLGRRPAPPNHLAAPELSAGVK